MDISHILIRPVLTEKSVHQEILNKYSFIVHQDATKIDVKNALNALYGVQVAHVNILHGLPKYRMGRARMPIQKKAPTRRAIVTLKAGEKLDLTKLKTPTKTKTAKN